MDTNETKEMVRNWYGSVAAGNGFQSIKTPPRSNTTMLRPAFDIGVSRSLLWPAG